jgi:hypothetical protein
MSIRLFNQNNYLRRRFQNDIDRSAKSKTVCRYHAVQMEMEDDFIQDLQAKERLIEEYKKAIDEKQKELDTAQRENEEYKRMIEEQSRIIVAG